MFDVLTGRSGLDWIESPWSLRPVAQLDDGTTLVWRLGRRKTVRTVVRTSRPSLIEWDGGGLSGSITIEADESGTYVRWTGAFPTSSRTVTEVLFNLVMRGKLARMASKESTEALAARISR